jgi:hypothetical protein
MAAESNTERRALVSSMRQALSAQPAHLVRGSSRRITIMRLRPANIRVINRRDDRLDRRPHCFPLAREEQRKSKPRMFLTGSSISELWPPFERRSALLVSEQTGFVANSDENRQ